MKRYMPIAVSLNLNTRRSTPFSSPNFRPAAVVVVVVVEVVAAVVAVLLLRMCDEVSDMTDVACSIIVPKISAD